MAMFKHDDHGFLVGELLDTHSELESGQASGLSIARDIRTDVRAIARAMGMHTRRGSSPGGRRAAPSLPTVLPVGRGGARSSTAQAGGRGARAPSAPLATGRPSTIVVANRNSRGHSTRASAPARDIERALGRQTPNIPKAPGGAADRDARGRFTAGGKPTGTSDFAGIDVSAKLTDTLGRLNTTLEGTDQIDPMIAAAREVRDAVTPLGRGLFGLMGRSAERRKERWYGRILKALTWRRDTPQAAVMGGGDGGGVLGGLFSSAGGILSMLGTVLSRVFAPVAAAWAGWELGQWIGRKVYDWLSDSGLMTRFFDAIGGIKQAFTDVSNWAQRKFEAVANTVKTAREDYRRGMDEQINPAMPAAKLPEPASASQRVGRAVGAVRSMFKSKAEKRAYETGSDYAAGNIGNLSDAQTRALVASTALTESGGGKLDVVNKAGYMGRYQAGAEWLADAGLIKGGPAAVKAAMRREGFTREYDWGKSGGMTRFLKNADNWNGGMSYEKYLGSAEAQDLAFKTNSDAAYRQLLALDPKKGGINKNTPPEVVAGLLKARHLAGLGGAKAVSKGLSGAADANGTTARKYFEDVSTDRHGFAAVYSGQTLTAGVKPVAPVIVPSAAPERLPAAPEVSIPTQLNSAKPVPVIVASREPIGQDVGDRNIAHVVSGGLGG